MKEFEGVVRKRRMFQVGKCMSKIMEVIMNWSEKRYILDNGGKLLGKYCML